MIHYELLLHEQADVSYDMSDAIRFSTSGKRETRTWHVDNDYFAGCFHEQRYADFDIVCSHIRSADDCCLKTMHDGTNFLSLGVVLKGRVCYLQGRRACEWAASDANILVASDYRDEFNYFRCGEDFEILNLVLSESYFRRLAEAYPSLFEPAYGRMLRGETFFMAERNVPVSPLLSQVLGSFGASALLGNCGEMYLASKIQESLALFMGHCPSEAVVAETPAVVGKMMEARRVLEAEYLSPPSLHALALRVGTNECTLKAMFKKTFGQTVFGYLFDYRMRVASRFLLDTGKPIAEVAALSGYEHTSHFCAAFRRKYGVSPMEFRRRRRGEKACANTETGCK